MTGKKATKVSNNNPSSKSKKNIIEKDNSPADLKQQYESALEGSRVGIWTWNVQSGDTVFNDRWAETIGYTLAEISPVSIDTWKKFTHPDDLKISDELLKKHFMGEQEFYECEVRMRHKNGAWIWVLDRGKVATRTTDGKPLLMSGTHLDITDRKQVEEAMINERTHIINILDSIPDGVYIVSKLYDIEYINPVLRNEFGSVNNRKCYEYFHGRAEVCPWCKNNDIFAGKSVRWEWYSSKNNRYYDLFDSPFKNADGSVSKLEIFRDITDRKLAEDALRESEERFKALHNASFGGITIHDKGVILECNRGLSQITGFTYDELIGMNGLLLVSEDTRDMAIENINSGYEKPYEAIGVRKNGQRYPIRLEARNIPYKGKDVRVVEFRDITGQKQTEAELEQHREHLEELVAERTKELEKRNEELESIHKNIIGREFRIKELRDQVKELKERLGE